MNFFRTFIQPLNDFFFRTNCFHCGGPLTEEENRLCRSCWNSLTPVLPNDRTFRIMSERFRTAGIIDEFIPLYYFEKGKVLQSLAHSLKYSEITSFGTELGMKIGQALKVNGISADAVVPVPLNRRKERERGYNQSAFLARGISAATGIPVWDRTVVRRKYTATQTQLNAEQRKENIADAFVVDPPRQKTLRGASIIIVDDIITTGSTILEIGKIVKEAGAAKVIAASAGLAKLGEDA